MGELTEGLTDALARIRDFEAVQCGAPLERMLEAVNLLQESVGISEHSRAALKAHGEEKGWSSARTAHALFGLIVGAMASQLEAERAGTADE